MADGSIWDEILDTRHVQVLRTYIERWPRKTRPMRAIEGVAFRSSNVPFSLDERYQKMNGQMNT